jgi:hypothetical protein
MRRFRLRTLMLVVAIAGLILGLILMEVRHLRAERELMVRVELTRARHEADLAACRAEILQLQAATAQQQAQAETLKQQLADLQAPAKPE